MRDFGRSWIVCGLLLASTLVAVAGCNVPARPSQTLDAVDALMRLPNLLNYRAVAGTLGIELKEDVNEYSTFNGQREPAVVRMAYGTPSKRYPDLKVDYDISYSGRRDIPGNVYPPETAETLITLHPQTECVRRADAEARYGRPSSSKPTSTVLTTYEWTVLHTGQRRVVLVLPNLSNTPTHDTTVPKMRLLNSPNDSLLLFAYGPSECEQYGIALREVRPDYHYRDVR